MSHACTAVKGRHDVGRPNKTESDSTPSRTSQTHTMIARSGGLLQTLQKPRSHLRQRRLARKDQATLQLLARLGLRHATDSISRQVRSWPTKVKRQLATMSILLVNVNRR